MDILVVEFKCPECGMICEEEMDDYDFDNKTFNAPCCCASKMKVEDTYYK